MKDWIKGFPLWEDMDEEMRMKFIRRAIEEGYRQEYEDSIEYYRHVFAKQGMEPPAWDDLSAAQKENIREIIQDNRKDMQKLGEMISKGNLK